MVADHRKTANELKALAPDVPAELDSSHQKMPDKLEGLTGDKFTKQYESDQVKARKSAVSLFQRYAKDGDGKERVALGVVAADTAFGNIVSVDDEPVDLAINAII